MGVRGVGSLVKYAMFLFNSVILVAGCGLVGLGIYARTNSNGITKFSSILGSNLLPVLSFVIIGVGGIVIILSFLGCCGAIKEVKCMLVMFFVILLIIFVAFVVGGVLIYVFRDNIRDVTLDELKYQLTSQYGEKEESAVTESWDYMQEIFQCCGISGGVNSTWSWGAYKLHSQWFANQSPPPGVKKKKHIIEFVPKSCCLDSSNTPNMHKCQGVTERFIIPAIGPPASEAQTNNQLFTQGCLSVFENVLASNLIVLICVGAGILVTMILGMIFSICLCQCIEEDDYDCDDD